MRWIWIDKFIEFESGRRAVAIKNVSLAEEHLHDHFPGYPVMPQSLLIEAMAQTSGILVGEVRNFQEKVILAKITKALFHDLARPGDQLRLEARIENMADEAASITGTIRCEGRLIGEISLMFSHIDKNPAGLEFPEENFVFNDQFMNLLQFYMKDPKAEEESQKQEARS
jgi:3-hydroxyacyl-[acyl-carrier-protein] dehydratase